MLARSDPAAEPVAGPSLADVTAALEERYDPATADSWDAVGLVCGDPERAVRRVHFAVDPVRATVDEAIVAGVQLLVTHHPLFLRGVHGVPAGTPKGALVHDLIRAGVGLFVAHTNADRAKPGVSDALAAAVGLHDTRALQPIACAELDKLVAFVPEADADRVLDAVCAAGAGTIGNYTRAAWTTSGEGTFRPGPGSAPHRGRVGEIERVRETRLETVLPRALRAAVVAALMAAHPYEQPAYDVLELAGLPGNRGLGRIGSLPEPLPFARFVDRVAAGLPNTAAGVRGAGDPDRVVSTVAVSGGAGDSLLDEVTRAGPDAFVTADLRHHPAAEHLLAGGPALVDVAHWASEWPWLEDAAALLEGDLGGAVETTVSTLVTDPWTVRAG